MYCRPLSSLSITFENNTRGVFLHERGMVVVNCSVPDCQFITNDVSEALAIALLANHGLAHQTRATATTTERPHLPRGPKLDRPRIEAGISTEAWNIFVRRWEVFRIGSGIDDSSAPSQLFQCAGPDLGDSLLKANPDAASESLDQLLAAMQSLAVIPVATCVLRTELLQLRQDRDEAFRAFSASVRGKAETCAFHSTCSCGNAVDYTDHIIRDVQLNGIYDPDIRREVLGTADILRHSVNAVIALVENKEMARNALPSVTMSAMSSLQRQRKGQAHNPVHPPDKIQEATCPDCKSLFKLFTEGARGWNTKPHQVCIGCYRARRQKRRPPSATMQAVEPSEPISQLASLQVTRPTNSCRRRRSRRHAPTTNTIKTPFQTRLGHHIFSKGEWRRAQLKDHPRVSITISLDKPEDPRRTRLQRSDDQVLIPAIADTGAQSDLWSLKEFLACGFAQDDLHPVSLSLSAANRSPIAIEGAFFARLTTTHGCRREESARSMVYVSSSVRSMYLSYESLLNLGLLPKAFPLEASSDNALIASTKPSPDTSCSCP